MRGSIFWREVFFLPAKRVWLSVPTDVQWNACFLSDENECIDRTPKLSSPSSTKSINSSLQKSSVGPGPGKIRPLGHCLLGHFLSNILIKRLRGYSGNGICPLHFGILNRMTDTIPRGNRLAQRIQPKLCLALYQLYHRNTIIRFHTVRMAFPHGLKKSQQSVSEPGPRSNTKKKPPSRTKMKGASGFGGIPPYHVGPVNPSIHQTWPGRTLASWRSRLQHVHPIRYWPTRHFSTPAHNKFELPRPSHQVDTAYAEVRWQRLENMTPIATRLRDRWYFW